MQIKKQGRQGDIFMVRVDAIPQDAQPQEPTKRLVVALGEVTGHAHVLTVEDGWIHPYTIGNDTYVDIPEAFLSHDEHTVHEYVAGTYFAGRQVEYSPKTIRRVTD